MMRFGSQLQTNWDWRAACNFMFGGTGSALVLAMVLVTLPDPAPIGLSLIALVFVGLGLFMVWLEIGRPWRFLHVFFHPQTSWMTREASVGTLLFPVTVIGALLQSVPILCIAAALGLIFLYCQGRILQAAKGIPAWRDPAIVPLIMSSGLVEGVAIATGYAFIKGIASTAMIALLMVLLAVRLWAWLAYRDALRRAQAPAATLQVLKLLDGEFMIGGVIVPLLLLGLGAGGVMPTALVALASLAAVVSGWRLKYGIVIKAAFKQGYGIGKLRTGRPTPKAPVRRTGDPIRY